jgi:hypothetical protein
LKLRTNFSIELWVCSILLSIDSKSSLWVTIVLLSFQSEKATRSYITHSAFILYLGFICWSFAILYKFRYDICNLLIRNCHTLVRNSSLKVKTSTISISLLQSDWNEFLKVPYLPRTMFIKVKISNRNYRVSIRGLNIGSIFNDFTAGKLSIIFFISIFTHFMHKLVHTDSVSLKSSIVRL